MISFRKEQAYASRRARPTECDSYEHVTAIVTVYSSSRDELPHRACVHAAPLDGPAHRPAAGAYG